MSESHSQTSLTDLNSNSEYQQEKSMLKIHLQDSEHVCLLYAASTIDAEITPTEDETKTEEAGEEESDQLLPEGKPKIFSSKECQRSRARLADVGTSNPLPLTAETSTFVSPYLLHVDAEERSEMESIRKPRRPAPWWNSHSCNVMERILFSLHSPPLQKQVATFETNPLHLDVVYKYQSKILNILFDDSLRGYKVSGVDQNFAQPYIFAVGLYEVRKGAVTIWSLKNMISPERLYRFDASVTCLQFSKQSPNMLAVGFYNGDVSVLDVSSKRKKILLQVPYVGSGIVSCIQWWKLDSEFLTFTNGHLVCKVMRPFTAAETKTLIQTAYMTSKDKMGIRRVPASFSITNGPTVRGLWHAPCEPETYILGDAEGEIRVCNIHSSYEFFDTFCGHIGVINAIKPSPFCDQLFLTCGSDGTARIWCLHIQEPLLTLATSIVGSDVRDVSWSPTHGTIIVGVTAQELCIWDIHRKHHEPVSITKLFIRPRCIEFSRDGSFLVIGTVAGSVLIMGLKDMPFPEYYKNLSVINALRGWIEVERKYNLLNDFMSTIKKPKIGQYVPPLIVSEIGKTI